MKVTERFLKYIKVETTSNEDSPTTPSTKNQLVLGQMLVDELLELGLSDAKMDQNGYVMATLPSNIDKAVDTIGFIAHMDTAPDLTTKDIKPRIVENYDGSVITLNAENDVVLSPIDFPELSNYVGNDLIVTDGNTLLGADDKAGIAEIMTAIELLVNSPEIKHGEIKVGFTPDEEIGRGADLFKVEEFGAKYAYTLDGGQIGELEYESFNAANLSITFNGRNVHPGTAKNTMVNAMELAMGFHAMLPAEQRPQYTEKYEGFFHMLSFEGTVDQAVTKYIVRDHDREKFEERKSIITHAADYINNMYGKGTVVVNMRDYYYNMGEKIEPVFFIVELAKEAMEDLGITPIIKPIRGGTDGSRLSYMGLPCPNIFAGGHNFHGRHEYVPVQSMEKAVETIVKIVEKFAER